MPDGAQPEADGHAEGATPTLGESVVEGARQARADVVDTGNERAAARELARSESAREQQLNRLMRELGLPSGSNLPSELAVLRQAMVVEVSKALAEPDSPETKRRIILKAAVKAQRALTEHTSRAKYGEGLWAAAKKALATPLGKIVTGGAAIGAGLVVPLSVFAPAVYTGGVRLAVEGLRQLTSGEGKLRQSVNDAHAGFDRTIEAALARMVITRDRTPEAISRFIHDFVDGVYLRELSTIFSLENQFEDAVQARATWQKGVPGKAGFAALAGMMPMDIDGIPTALGAMKGGDLGQHFVAGLNNFYAGNGHWGTVGLLKGNALLNMGMLAGNLLSAGAGFAGAGQLIKSVDASGHRLSTEGVTVRSEVDDAAAEAAHRTTAPSFHTPASAPTRTAAQPTFLGPPAPAVSVGAPPHSGDGSIPKPASAPASPIAPPPPGSPPPPPPPPPPPETSEQRIKKNDPEFWREIFTTLSSLIASEDTVGLLREIPENKDQWKEMVKQFDDDPSGWARQFQDGCAAVALAAITVRLASTRLNDKTLSFSDSDDLEDYREFINDQLVEDLDRFDEILAANPVMRQDVPELTAFVNQVRNEVKNYCREFATAFPIAPENSEAAWSQLVDEINADLRPLTALDPFDVAIAVGSIQLIPYESSQHGNWATAVKDSFLVTGRFEQHIAEVQHAQVAAPLNIDDIPPVQQQISAATQRLLTLTDSLLATNPDAAAVQPLRDWLTLHLKKPVASYQAELTQRLDEWRNAPDEWTRLLNQLDEDAAANWRTLDDRIKDLPKLPDPIPDPKTNLAGWTDALEKSAGTAFVWRSFASEQADKLSKRTTPATPEELTAWNDQEQKVRTSADSYRRVLSLNPDFSTKTEAQRALTELTAAADTFLAEIQRMNEIGTTTSLLTADREAESQTAINNEGTAEAEPTTLAQAAQQILEATPLPPSNAVSSETVQAAVTNAQIDTEIPPYDPANPGEWPVRMQSLVRAMQQGRVYIDAQLQRAGAATDPVTDEEIAIADQLRQTGEVMMKAVGNGDENIQEQAELFVSDASKLAQVLKDRRTEQQQVERPSDQDQSPGWPERQTAAEQIETRLATLRSLVADPTAIDEGSILQALKRLAELPNQAAKSADQAIKSLPNSLFLEIDGRWYELIGLKKKKTTKREPSDLPSESATQVGDAETDEPTTPASSKPWYGIFRDEKGKNAKQFSEQPLSRLLKKPNIHVRLLPKSNGSST